MLSTVGSSIARSFAVVVLVEDDVDVVLLLKASEGAEVITGAGGSKVNFTLFEPAMNTT